MRRVNRPFLMLAMLLGAAGAANAADTLALRLHFDTGRTGATTIGVEHAQRGDFALVQPALDESESDRSWLLQSLDAQGRVLYQTPIRNHRRRRLEAFDPVSGRIAVVREILEPQGAFDVSLPYDGRMARVVIRNNTATAGTTKNRLRAKQTRPLGEFYRQHLDAMLHSRIPGAPKAASATLLVNNGSPSDHLDLVFVGDGYTASEMGKWQADAQTVINTMMADPLFAANRAAINIRRIDVDSAESGVDEPDRGIFRDTAMDSAFYCANIDRLLCASSTKVYAIAGSVLAPDARDVIVVVANSTRYGGSGGSFAAISMHAQSTELALHELGHTLFGLADEYDYGTCSTSSEPAAGNVSLVADRTVKWHPWIAFKTTVPTPLGKYPNGTVGIFLGGQYCTAGKYRPTENSRMRTLGQPWHRVNEVLAAKVFARYQGAYRPRERPVQPGIPADGGP